MKRFLLFELTLITFLGLLYWGMLAPNQIEVTYDQPDGLDLQALTTFLTNSAIRPDAAEHERLTGNILPIKTGLGGYGRIPAWNPYLANGVPLLNNPFGYLFNPFHSLPVLVLGGVQGSKLALLITFLMAGYGMWALGLSLGLGSLARVTSAVFYMLSGSLIAKFGAGHFQLANSLAWPPLVFAALWWVLRSRSRIAPVMVGVTFALLFYAGNIYYVLHTGLCCVTLVGAHAVRRQNGHLRWQVEPLRRAFTVGVLAFGLSALAFFPVWQTRDFVTHQRQIINPDGTLQANYDLNQTAANLTTPWEQWASLQRPDFTGLIGAVDYAYIGVVLFVLVGAAVVIAALRPGWAQQYLRDKRGVGIIILIVPLLAVFMMAWAGGQFAAINGLYARFTLLAEFRYVGRALAFAGLWWIVLGGVALDFLWHVIRKHRQLPVLFAPFDRVRLIRAMGVAGIVWLYFVIYSAASLETRVNMTLRNLQWWQRLDTMRFTSITAAVETLFVFVIVAVILDSVLLILERLILVPLLPVHRDKYGLTWSAVVSRFLCLPLVLAVVAGVWDVMRSNAPAIQFSRVDDPFETIYDVIHERDTGTPFPAVKLPYTTRSFSGYEKQIRNWGLNEGWLPAATPGLLPAGQVINNLPRWGVMVRDGKGGIPVEGDQQFLDEAGYVRRDCYQAGVQTPTVCSGAPNEIELYENPLALPYTFVIGDQALRAQPDSVNGATVIAAAVVAHQLDNITVSAITPTDGDYWLVVQESNFPGWRAMADGTEMPISTVQTGYKDEQQLGLIAVAALPGEHTYTFQFEAPGFNIGIVVFGLTVLGAVIYLYRGRRPGN